MRIEEAPNVNWGPGALVGRFRRSWANLRLSIEDPELRPDAG